ncbi:hypothetical protein [Myceligenerans pegani]|uniref:Uncharacterized protein n=1 Tax=Myceligenerans pegani TaxID=2776917 RepID=A0ABR9N2L6_9MICO|nr:hypothetical protein [Myceligenerans sp. TRM 65318]MBE1877890.1 hypothetical protein [Myceligenerans sp. TRM 65318]MBE3020161.1 hypothetical protein [Myceligenerans sp. TRM 65318]
MTNFQVAHRDKQEPTAALLVRVIVCFALFAGGLALIGVGTAAGPSEDLGGALAFTGGILLVGLSFGLPMLGAHER